MAKIYEFIQFRSIFKVLIVQFTDTYPIGGLPANRGYNYLVKLLNT